MHTTWGLQDFLEISDKVKMENNYCTIRIMGIQFYGKYYNELARNIENAGYDPKQYLAQKELNLQA